jgi:nitrile hydratase accessory protein
MYHGACLDDEELRPAMIGIRPDDPAAAGAAANESVCPLPDLPRDTGGPVFREPWEAQAFALAVALHRRGLFSWDEWAATLGAEIKAAQRAGDPDTGVTYYHHWLKALERILAVRGIADGDALARHRDAWARAAGRTPHGSPIELTAEDFLST